MARGMNPVYVCLSVCLSLTDLGADVLAELECQMNVSYECGQYLELNPAMRRPCVGKGSLESVGVVKGSQM